MKKDTGGFAFPMPEHLFSAAVNEIESMDLREETLEKTVDQLVSAATGMTLRDYFAAKAMQGIAANQRWNVTNQIDNCAREAYAIADAMIAERNKQ
jgi:hypothetical protein